MNEPINISSNNLWHDLPASCPNIPCLSNTRKADQQTSSWMYILQRNCFFIYSVHALRSIHQNPDQKVQWCMGPRSTTKTRGAFCPRWLPGTPCSRCCRCHQNRLPRKCELCKHARLNVCSRVGIGYMLWHVPWSKVLIWYSPPVCGFLRIPIFISYRTDNEHPIIPSEVKQGDAIDHSSMVTNSVALTVQ